MNDIVIRVDHVSKEYVLGAERPKYDTLRDQIAGWSGSLFGRRRKRDAKAHAFLALDDVSLEIRKGEVIGLIGRNGAGKSTLLKILSRITEPTSGSADIYGRVAALLEVGTGFHGELSGRDNIFLNGAILGMRRTEIARKFDAIVEFAEVEKFIDTPVKHYSSGMYVRLAFAVAAHLEPEILLVDEVLAVGDTGFQRKCLGKMGEVARDGRTIVFVSHNLAAVEGLCTGAYMLSQGRVALSGSTPDVIAAYLSSFPLLASSSLEDRADRKGDGKMRFTDLQLLSDEDAAIDVIQCGKNVRFSVGYKSEQGPLQNVEISVEIYTDTGQCMIIMNSEMVGQAFDSAPEAGRFSCRLERFPLYPGRYHITLFARVNGVVADWMPQAVPLTVEAGDFFGSGRLPPSTHGGFLVPQKWELEGGSAVSIRALSAVSGDRR